MVEITLQIPESLAEKLVPLYSRLPEILAHGLADLPPLPNEVYRYILGFLANRPSPEELINFAPTEAMQKRASELLAKNRTNSLSEGESQELDEYVRIQHFMTMLKANALPYLTTQ